MSVYTALSPNTDIKLGGLICFSGYILQEKIILKNILHSINKDVPTFIYHGEDDQVVPIKKCLDGFNKILPDMKNSILKTEKNQGHEISDDQVNYFFNWFHEKTILK
jgi:predicted esterase